MKRMSKKRREMGEVTWKKYQQERIREKNRKFRIRHPERYVNRDRDVKEELVKYKGGKCIKCGYDKCGSAMDFHHRNPDEKEFSFSANHRSLEKFKKEADKCDLLCRNCHAELHDVIWKERREIRIEELKQMSG